MYKFTHDGVTFVNNAGGTPYNIGDELCSPFLYYDFLVEEHLRDQVLVVGGGAFETSRTVFADEYRNRIVWAVGGSSSIGRGVRGILSRRRQRQRINSQTNPVNETGVFSSRDLNSEAMFVPCPSCVHPLASAPRGSGTGVVLNANPRVSGNVNRVFAALKSDFPDAACLTNAASEQDLREIMRQTNRIVTNSYHIAYWSLLSGGEVKVLSYSTKLASVLQIFGFEDETTKYEKASDQSLSQAVKSVLNRPDWLSIDEPDTVRARFRDQNREFAAEAAKKIPGLTITPRPEILEQLP